MERAKRIELSSQPWQGRVLPLNHARKNLFCYQQKYYNKFYFKSIGAIFLRYVLFCTARRTAGLFFISNKYLLELII